MPETFVLASQLPIAYAEAALATHPNRPKRATLNIGWLTLIFTTRIILKRTLSIVALLTLSLSTVAQAHPGHGTSDSSHYLSEPEHLASLALIVSVSLLLLAGKFYGQSLRSVRPNR